MSYGLAVRPWLPTPVCMYQLLSFRNKFEPRLQSVGKGVILPTGWGADSPSVRLQTKADACCGRPPAKDAASRRPSGHPPHARGVCAAAWGKPFSRQGKRGVSWESNTRPHECEACGLVVCTIPGWCHKWNSQDQSCALPPQKAFGTGAFQGVCTSAPWISQIFYAVAAAGSCTSDAKSRERCHCLGRARGAW